MEALRIEQIVKMAGGRLLRGERQTLALRVTTDSRAIRPGDCFVALRGERFDGHQFLADVARAGAVAAIVGKYAALPRRATTALIQVDDTLKALQQLAGNYRDTMNIKIVAITGSNGKTTTKEMTAAILAKGFSVIKNKGNFNNHIGVPLSLLQMDASHQVGVFEAGTNHPGEIGVLASLLKPHVSIITNIGCAHIEHFGSKEAIAREKGMLVEALGKDSVAVLNADDEWSASIAKRCHGRVVTVGIQRSADFCARNISENESLEFEIHETVSGQRAHVRMPVLGRHNVSNALQAAAVGRMFGLGWGALAEALATIRPPKMRMEVETVNGVKILNDAYNANPDSMRCALESFSSVRVAGRKIAVLGDMKELGTIAAQAHEDIGAIVAKTARVKMLVTVGSMARLIGEAAKQRGLATHLVVDFQTAEEAGDFLKLNAEAGDCILLKASRSVGLEKIVTILKGDGFAPSSPESGRTARTRRAALVGASRE